MEKGLILPLISGPSRSSVSSASGISWRRAIALACTIVWILTGLSSWERYASRSTRADRRSFPDLYDASIHELQTGLDAGDFTSVHLVQAYFARIAEVNPTLHAVIETNPSALRQAAELDKERRLRGKRGWMHGIPVLLKDNIATVASERMNTTAGSYSLLGSVVPEDAGVVKRLRRAGAIILGKSNMCEFAHARGYLASGWSGRGGQATSAYFPNGSPGGSSGGSGIATSIGLATVSLGTETDGSITYPSSMNNIVGVKPTVGLTSRAGVIPISLHQDTVGPMTRSVADAAILLGSIAGIDPNDNFTLAQPSPLPDYIQALDQHGIRGKRIGVPRSFVNSSLAAKYPVIMSQFQDALHVMQTLGAQVVDPANVPTTEEILSLPEMERSQPAVVEFKVTLNEYYSSLISNPSGVRSMAELIEFNDAHPELEKPEGYEGQELLIRANHTDGYDSDYYAARSKNYRLGYGIDTVLKELKLDALVLPHFVAPVSATPAMAGYPIVTVPLGFFPESSGTEPMGAGTFFPAPGMPFGLTFFGTAYSEFTLIQLAYAFEQETRVRRLGPRGYSSAVPKTQLDDVVQRARGNPACLH
ncbi:unnamed protein product [Mycena citricolor]|uniref:Amidase domain-containing protein n=1 Tax=Mycena citricolor TaxID=2018698 RepID=A0AAD2K4R4_9AGAR|nr:unnamed protein product [Mycena citricolor]